MTNRPFIEVNHLRKTFVTDQQERVILSDINFNILEHEFICVVGPSGCGKTTLLNLIAGHLTPDSGELFMNQMPITHPEATRGVVFQTPMLYPWLTIAKNIEYGPKIQHQSRDEIQKKTAELMREMGLEGYYNAYPYELSGGMKQRAALARTLINKPQLVLMDEPFSALDALNKQAMHQLVQRLWAQNQQTYFLITHDIDEALKLGTRLLVMGPNEGTILLDQSLAILRSKASDATRQIEEDSDFVELKKSVLNLISR